MKHEEKLQIVIERLRSILARAESDKYDHAELLSLTRMKMSFLCEFIGNVDFMEEGQDA